jgi:hypothetical protein
MIVLSQLDTRYFRDISGRSRWSLDFVVYKQGETEAIAESLHARYFSRSVNLEIPLEAGEYVVHVGCVLRYNHKSLIRHRFALTVRTTERRLILILFSLA